MKEAVEDIINRGVGELRKNAFGDDVDDAKSLDWSREQAWLVLKKLAKQEEVGLRLSEDCLFSHTTRFRTMISW